MKKRRQISSNDTPEMETTIPVEPDLKTRQRERFEKGNLELVRRDLKRRANDPASSGRFNIHKDAEERQIREPRVKNRAFWQCGKFGLWLQSDDLDALQRMKEDAMTVGWCPAPIPGADGVFEKGWEQYVEPGEGRYGVLLWYSQR